MKPPVIFVGDGPSSKNYDPNIPFVGTQSGKRLMEWIKWLNYSPAIVVNQSQEGFAHYVDQMLAQNLSTRFVALGRVAEKALKKLGLTPYYMPHPSARNRLTNDPNIIDKYLENLYYEIHGTRKPRHSRDSDNSRGEVQCSGRTDPST